MALLPLHDTPRPPSRPLHPAVGLAGGFGLIVAAALLVHVVFNAVM